MSSATMTLSQESWLRSQLESIPREDWCIVMSHTFYYCSGPFEDGWAWYDNEKTIDATTTTIVFRDPDNKELYRTTVLCNKRSMLPLTA